MTDATADWRSTLSLMSEAFRVGENGRAEELLCRALDSGAPWDIATSTVARAVHDARLAADERGDFSEPAPA